MTQKNSSVVIHHYLFQDKDTNEIFPVETSLAITQQALERSPKYILAKLEYSMGLGTSPMRRFELVEGPNDG